jgi:hypothetical protein
MRCLPTRPGDSQATRSPTASGLSGSELQHAGTSDRGEDVEQLCVDRVVRAGSGTAGKCSVGSNPIRISLEQIEVRHFPTKWVGERAVSS